jgi:hypothetical protein
LSFAKNIWVLAASGSVNFSGEVLRGVFVVTTRSDDRISRNPFCATSPLSVSWNDNQPVQRQVASTDYLYDFSRSENQ